jgi:5-(carboxyamino)imidazole ribonucleotide synthase
MTSVFLPPARIGIVGGGQLGMMLIREAHRMGYRTAAWDPDPQCPAARLADILITAPFSDRSAADQLAANADVVTYEFENVDPNMVQYLESQKPLFPGSEILKIARHRRYEKEQLKSRGFPVVPYRLVNGNQQSTDWPGELRFPVVFKTLTSGYDGKGQVVIGDSRQAVEFLRSAAVGVEYVAEEFLDLQCEISVLVTRSKQGTISVFPVAENLHRENILHITRLPARIPDSLIHEAGELARAIADSFNMVGLLCVEMFVTRAARVVVNELAPRPHNSGHYSLDACSMSQFEALIRTMCGLSVPQPRLLAPCAMVNVLGKHLEQMDLEGLSKLPGVKVHLYGKSRKEPKRKMGHITITGSEPEQVEHILRRVTEFIGEPMEERGIIV